VQSQDKYISTYRFDHIPFEEIESFGQRSLLKRDLFAVSWLLGRFCNYKCSYCWPYARADKKDHRPTELILKNILEIKKQARERQFNSFHFSFSGGEPTFHPGYLEILSFLSEDTMNCNYQSVHMTSNCSQPIAWFEKYAETTKNLNRVSITASFHKEFCKKNILSEKLIFLQSKEIQITINMVMVPERFEELWDDALYFQDLGINVTLKPQSNKSATAVVDGYSESQIEKLKLGMPQKDFTQMRIENLKLRSTRPKPLKMVEDNTPKDQLKNQVELRTKKDELYFIDQAERFNAFGFNNFEGWDCSAGYRSVIIREPDGVVKRGYSCKDEILGTLNDGFKIFENIKTCISKSCVSSADSKIPKRKKGSRQPLWPNTSI
jgi:organic radical activating enzyme